MGNIGQLSNCHNIQDILNTTSRTILFPACRVVLEYHCGRQGQLSLSEPSLELLGTGGVAQTASCSLDGNHDPTKNNCKELKLPLNVGLIPLHSRLYLLLIAFDKSPSTYISVMVMLLVL